MLALIDENECVVVYPKNAIVIAPNGTTLGYVRRVDTVSGNITVVCPCQVAMTYQDTIYDLDPEYKVKSTGKDSMEFKFTVKGLKIEVY